ncbi:MAG: hypothetical protein QXR44_04060 [Thermoproteota archaeon]
MVSKSISIVSEYFLKQLNVFNKIEIGEKEREIIKVYLEIITAKNIRELFYSLTRVGTKKTARIAHNKIDLSDFPLVVLPD